MTCSWWNKCCLISWREWNNSLTKTASKADRWWWWWWWWSDAQGRSYSWVRRGSCFLCFEQREAKKLRCKFLFNRNRFVSWSSYLYFLKRCYGVLKTCIYRTRNGEMVGLWTIYLKQPKCVSFWGLRPPDPLPGLRPWTPLGDFLTRNSQSASASGGVVPRPPTRASPLHHWGTRTSVPAEPLCLLCFPALPTALLTLHQSAVSCSRLYDDDDE